MDAFKSWLLNEATYLVVGSCFFVSAAVTAGLWKVFDWIHDSQFRTVARTALCIPIIAIGWMSVGGMIALFFREAPSLSFLAKLLFEGPWISIVFFRAMPARAKYIALPFLALYASLHLTVGYFSFLSKATNGFTVFDGVSACLATATAITTYFVLFKLNVKQNQRVVQTAASQISANEPQHVQ